MKEIASKIREIGFPEGISSSIYEEAEATWFNECLREGPEYTALDWLGNMKYSQIYAATKLLQSIDAL